MKLAVKLTILFLLLSIVPLAIVGYIAYNNSRNTIEQNSRSRLLSTTFLKQSNFNHWLEASQLQLRQLSKRPLVKEYTSLMTRQGPTHPQYQFTHSALVTDHLAAALDDQIGFVGLFLLDATNGKIIASTDSLQEGMYRLQEPYFTEGKKRAFIDNVRYSLSMGQAAMHISTPVTDETGNTVGVLVGQVNMNQVSQIMLNKSERNPTEETYLVNKFNYFVTEPEIGQDFALKKAVYTQGVANCLAGNNNVGFYLNYRDTPVIGAYRWMPERELCILTEVTQQEAFAPIHRLREVMIGVGGLVAATVAVLGIIVTRTITQPVQHLVTGAEAIGQGNLDHRIDIKTHDELGTLATAFNDMAIRRQRMEDELRQAHDDLEQRVQERTEALQKSEAELRALFKAMSDVVLVLDGEGRYLKAPTSNKNLLYKSAEQLIGRTIHQVLPAELADSFYNRIQQVIKSGQRSADFEYQLEIDGRTTWFNATISPVLQNAVLWVARDITDRKQNQFMLQQLNRQLEQTNYELRVLYKIGTLLAAALDPHKIYRVIFEEVGQKLLKTPHLTIATYHLDPQTITCDFAIIDYKEVDTAQFPAYQLGEGPTSETIRSRKPKIVDLKATIANLQNKNRVTHIGDEQEPQSALYLPMISGDKVVAVMNFQSYQANAFDDTNMSLLVTIANQAAVVLEQAKLFQAVQDYSLRLEAQITERKKAERALRESEEKYRLLAETARDIILTHDMDGNITYFNKAGFKISGYSKAELKKLHITQIIPDSQLNHLKNRHNKRAAGDDRVYRYEVEMINKQARLIPLEVISSLLTKDKKPVGVLILARDITDRKQAEQALRESEERFRTIAEATPVPLLITRVSDGVMLFANRQFCLQHGVPLQQIIGQKVPDLYYNPEDRERLLKKLSAEGTLKSIELQSKRLEDGRPFWASVSAQFITYNGEKAVLGAFVDISNRLEMEESLRRSNAELEQFAYVASHDLQEPLRMVISYLQLLERRTKDKLDGEALEFIDYAVDGAIRMKGLINDLLAYSRVGTHGQASEPVACNQVLNQVLANLQLAIKENDATITHGPLPVVTGDARQLAQLFQNLISNALKFHNINRPTVHIDAQKQSDKWCFSVADNGIGIEEEFLKKIFVIFRRLHTSSQYPGTGIGLAICKKIIERHGGEIWVESRPGQGSTFYFTLPQ